MSQGKEVPKRWSHLSPAKQQLLEKLSTGQRYAKASPNAGARNRDPIPLSFAQKRLWFLNQLDTDNTIYNVAAAVRLRGKLNVEAFERTLSEIIRRHETLRTTFANVNGSPVQIVGPAQPVKMLQQDLTCIPTTERESRAREFAKAEIRQPFDLSHGPLLRVILLRLDEEDFVVLLTMHHIISDGLSMSVLVHEIGTIYQAFLVGQPSPLAELPAQYADFARWQSKWLQGEVLERERAFWRQQLSGKLTVLNLPDRARSVTRSHKGGSLTLELSPEVTEKLRSLCRREGVTMFMALLAAYKVLLHWYSGQEDIIVGSPISNRKRAQFENLIGLFIDTLVLRTDLSGNPSFIDLLARVREVALNAYNHPNMPFEKLVEELQPGRSSQTPIFQVWMNLENTASMELQLPELTISAFPIEKQWSKFDLALLVHEKPETIECLFEYDADLFESITISRYAGAFKTILDEVLARPQTTLSSLNQSLAEQDRQTRLAEQREYEDSIQRKLRSLRRAG